MKNYPVWDEEQQEAFRGLFEKYPEGVMGGAVRKMYRHGYVVFNSGMKEKELLMDFLEALFMPQCFEVRVEMVRGAVVEITNT